MLARRLALLPLLAPFLMGAGSKSCSAEADPGDGSADAWDIGEVPAPSRAPLPMSCEWLTSDNCWKKAVAKASSCAPGNGIATFDEQRSSCSYAGGSLFDFEGTVASLDPGEIHVPIMDHRLVGSDGRPCYTAKILGVGEVAIDVSGQVYLFQNLSLTSYRLTCPDGTSYQNDLDGTCSSFGADWLGGKTPGADLLCDGDTQVCTLQAKGGPAGPETLARCGD